jgi:hypothetical protein
MASPFAWRARALVLLAAVTGAGACRTWRAAELPRDGASVQRPAVATGRARLTYVDGRVDDVFGAYVAQDTLRAERYVITRAQGRVALAVPMDSVQALEVRRVSWGRTLGLVVGVYGAVALLGVLLYAGVNGL